MQQVSIKPYIKPGCFYLHRLKHGDKDANKYLRSTMESYGDDEKQNPEALHPLNRN